MALIDMRNVTKDYLLGDTVVHALRGIDLEIEKGEFVAIWGPSGSGKTTLLNLIGAIDEPSSGELHIENQEIGGFLTIRRQNSGIGSSVSSSRASI